MALCHSWFISFGVSWTDGMSDGVPGVLDGVLRVPDGVADAVPGRCWFAWCA